MKSLPVDYYPPLARKALIFLNAAKMTSEIINRNEGSYEVSYYLLSHSVELSMKAVIEKHTGTDAPQGHDIEELAEMYKKICGTSEAEMKTIRKLKALNEGRGGLRYPNTPKGKFLPSTFKNGVLIVERLLKTFE